MLWRRAKALPASEAPAPELSPAARDALQSYTMARIALERTGISLATRPLLQFQLAHAQARDAVKAALDVRMLCGELRRFGMDPLALKSCAPDRTAYLRRPDLGRSLSPDSLSLLTPGDYNVAFVIVDGLSAIAAERHALHVLQSLLPMLAGWRVAPMCVVEQGRVAIGDEIGEALHADLVVVLIGERPGLTSPDSLGAYITARPRRGRKDSERNCISNIRDEGLQHNAAAQRLFYYMTEGRRLGVTGLAIKDPAQDPTDLLPQ